MWSPLQVEQPSRLNDTVIHLHHAAQFLAMFSNSYLPAKDDDSQNNFEWNEADNKIVGRPADPGAVSMTLSVASFELSVERNPTSTILISGHSRNEVDSLIRDALTKTDLDPEEYNPVTQFKLPHHDLDEQGRFMHPNQTLTSEWCRYLSNTKLLLSTIARQSTHATPIRIWPHHFDLAMLLVLSRDSQHKASATVGLGLAIADDLVSEPYWYVNLWSQNPVQFSQHKTLESDGDWRPHGYNGMTLPAGRITTESGQENEVALFFAEGINTMCAEAGLPSPVKQISK